MSGILRLPASLIVLPFYLLGRYKNFAIFLLILTVSVSPRIHLGTLQYGKLMDIRYEDILMVFIIISWMIYSVFRGTKFYISPLGRPIMLYLLLAFGSTSLGLIMGWVEPLRASFFYLKEVEFFLMFFIVINFVKNMDGMKAALYAFAIGAIANSLYVLHQYLSGNIGGMEDPTFTYRYYGISMLGESGPAAVGTYFSLLLLFWTALFSFSSNNALRFISLISIVLSISGMIGSMSRISVWGIIIVFPLYLLLLFTLRKVKIRTIGILAALAIIVSFVFFSSNIIYRYILKTSDESAVFITRVVDIENIGEKYFRERVEDVYIDYIKVISMDPIFGLGKSITGQLDIPGLALTSYYGESHNHYIRIIAEMGIVGLLVFLYIILSVIKFSYRLIRDSFPPFSFIGLLCFGYTFFLLIESLAQDIFVIARATELFWILAGLLMVAHRWKQEKSA